MIYQELALAPALSVEANILLGQERSTAGLMHLREHRRIAAEALELLEHPDIRPEAKVRDLGVGAQQLVEVARALVSQARVIVFDEPTSSLSERDAERLFAIIDRLKARGLAIVYISHFLEEVRRVARTYTVLRDGRSVAEGDLAGTDLRSIIGHMVGRDLGELFPRVPHTPGETVLELKDFRAGTRGRPANLALRRGEILGLAGLVGAGRTRLVRAVFGLEPVVAGRVRVGHVEGGYATPRRRIEQGLGFLSEDRKGEGLALGLSIEDNMTYSGLRSARAPRLAAAERAARRGRAVDRPAPDRGVRPAPSRSADSRAATSRRWRWRGCSTSTPTSSCSTSRPAGIDVGSKAEIYRLLGELAAQGKAILVVSSYLPELFGICDRIAVMSRGSLTEALPVDRWTEHRVMEVATRGRGGGLRRAAPEATTSEDLRVVPASHRRSTGLHRRGRSHSGGSWAGAGRSSGRSWAWC